MLGRVSLKQHRGQNTTSWFTSEDASANYERRMYLTRNRRLMIIEGELYCTDRKLAQHRASVSGGNVTEVVLRHISTRSED